MAREINASEYEAEVVGSPVPVLLDVYGEHCPPCRQLAPVIEKLAAHYEGRARVLKIEAGANREVAGPPGDLLRADRPGLPGGAGGQPTGRAPTRVGLPQAPRIGRRLLTGPGPTSRGVAPDCGPPPRRHRI